MICSHRCPYLSVDEGLCTLFNLKLKTIGGTIAHQWAFKCCSKCEAIKKSEE